MGKWDTRFMEMAEMVASWSKDPSTKVGAVIVRPDRTIAGVGYNGFPRGTPDDDELYENREHKYPRVIHAEANAIFNSTNTQGTTIYTTVYPCSSCAGFIIQNGIKRVVTQGGIDRPNCHYTVSMELFRSAGVEVEFYKPHTA